jgi:hypothetical protein
MECQMTFQRSNYFRVFYKKSYRNYKDFYKYVPKTCIETFYLRVEREKYKPSFNDLNNYVFTEKFLGLKSITLYNKLECMISIDFKDMLQYLPVLEHLNLYKFEMLNFSVISKNIKYLYLKKCKIMDVFNSDFLGKNINDLALIKNEYSVIDEPLDFKNLNILENLWLSHITLDKIPIFTNSMSKLANLTIQNSNIQDGDWNEMNLPDSIHVLKIYFNSIRIFPQMPRNLEFLDISNNLATRFPSNLVMCRNLADFIYDEDFIIPTLQEIRFIRFIEMNETDDIYQDEQNIHNSFVQKSLVTSCRNLFTDSFPDTPFTTTGNIKVDDIINLKIFACLEIHMILQITLRELFQKVWNRIQNSNIDIRDELMQRLYEEILDSENMCFTGKFTRLVNVFSGFYDDIQIQIGTSDQILAKMKTHFGLHGEIKREILVQELLEIVQSIEIINEYIDAFIASLY